MMNSRHNSHHRYSNQDNRPDSRSSGQSEGRHYRNARDGTSYHKNDRNGGYNRGGGHNSAGDGMRYNHETNAHRYQHKDFKDTRNGNKVEPKRVADATQPSAQMPGIAVTKNSQSTTPFVSDSNGTNGSQQEVVTTEKAEKEATTTTTTAAATLDAMTDGMKQMDLKTADVRKEEDQKEPPEEVKSAPQNAFNTEKVYRSKGVEAEVPLTRDRRSYTVSGVNDNRYQRYHRTFQRNGFNDSVRNHINTNKFYANDRYNTNAKYESNDYNKRPQKPKQLSPQKPQNNAPLIYDCTPNVNLVNPYAINPCAPVYPYQDMYYNYYPIPIAYNPMLMQPSVAPNTGLNTDHNELVPKNANHNIVSTDKSSMTFFSPFEPTLEHPYPPMYYGYIEHITDSNGATTQYFVCTFPPNITPLRVDVTPTGVPIIPANCFIANTFQNRQQ
ncbi:unnamed protein product [Medioppia subpectinata]|uniref:Uncharacterized protein n=1 Tax=Medioppia subpectinata TaxID=1979941 RepID=A0A7R9KY38_9ACAR|nr:unnamed protein product [Medioppia subpectinata]CAG2112007.1 unnamed protein product [Medioppia subpectinata]